MITYVLDGHTLNVVDVFIAFMLYQSIRLSVTVAAPFSVQHISEALVALKRIQVVQCY